MLLRIGSILVLISWAALAQQPVTPAAAAAPAAVGRGGATPAHDHNADILIKQLEIDKWYKQLGDIAEVNEIRYTSLPPHKPENPTAPGAKNPLIIRAIVFVPKNIDKSKKQPLIVFAHQGIHSDFGHDYEYSAVRELVQQGYSVIGPDYRGSTGYGGGFYNEIDYGGYEVDDVFAAREWMLENYDFLDPKRVGMMGWSHGGFITLLNILLHPGAYAAAYAGVPVTDLVLRLGYHDAAYQAIFSAPRHIGKTVQADVQEYLKRSPITYADKLETPLLIHGNTNDEDVNVIEVQRFVAALKAAGKKFDYKIYDNAPGGHEFGRLDTKLARDSRHDVYKFLAGYLKPERPVQ
ncbi:MAG TPA: prolyl oligopeptidase family serine peptidase [Bryobacteraceae bacterium]|jgi:dipeptidyl aminopeptidase/acylaminoacyl peptidase|nr:prolyl oligopeptidase family serine peptidase [Bryobacteraceae bacterium]